MIKKILSLILVGTTVGMISCSKTQTEVGQEEVKEQTMKIVSSTVVGAQVMNELGLDLVGIPTTKSTLPEKYLGVTEIGQSFEPNFETVVSLAPDLVVFDGTFKDKVSEQVSQYNLNAFYFDTTSFTNFKNSIVELGKVTEREEKAEELANTLQESVDKVLDKATKDKEDIKVAIIFGTSESFMLATDTSYIGDLLNTINVENITDTIEGVDSGYINFSLEQIVKDNPDYILRLSHGDVEAAKKAFDDEFAINPAWQALDAVKNNKVYDLDSTVFGVSANLNVTEAIEELGNIIYGE